MSPILVRPVREQLEHDRVIRLLQAKYKRKSEVAINPGNQQTMPVGVGPSAWYPDLVLYVSEKNRKVLGVVEVETAESMNNLEAMSQWAAFSRFKVPFHLYIPAAYVDVARRLCSDLQITPPELWTYQSIGDQIRFAMVQRGAYAEPKAAAKPVEPTARSVAKPVDKPAARPQAARSRRPAAPAARRAAAPARRKSAAASAKPARAAKSSRKPASSRAQKRR